MPGGLWVCANPLGVPGRFNGAQHMAIFRLPGRVNQHLVSTEQHRAATGQGADDVSILPQPTLAACWAFWGKDVQFGLLFSLGSGRLVPILCETSPGTRDRRWHWGTALSPCSPVPPSSCCSFPNSPLSCRTAPSSLGPAGSSGDGTVPRLTITANKSD